MLIDCHMHTPLCGHATGHPLDYVRSAARQGIGLITFTCHIPMETPGFWQRGMRMSFQEFPEYLRLVEMARVEGAGLGVEVLCGIEAEIFPEGRVMEEMQHTLEAHPFDFILGSLHHPSPAYQQWLRQNQRTTDEDIIRSYFAHLTLAAMSGRYHSLAHLDVIRLYGTVSAFQPALFAEDIRRVLTTAHHNGVHIEVNTSGLSKGDYVIHPDPLILDWMREIGNRLTLGSDAHQPDSVGQHFPEAIELLKAKGFAEVYYFRKGLPVAVPLE